MSNPLDKFMVGVIILSLALGVYAIIKFKFLPKEDFTLTPKLKAYDSEGRYIQRGMVEWCVGGHVYYSYGKQLSPKFDEDSKVVTCG